MHVITTSTTQYHTVINMQMDKKQHTKLLENTDELDLVSKMDTEEDFELYDDETCKELKTGKYDPMIKTTSEDSKQDNE